MLEFRTILPLKQTYRGEGGYGMSAGQKEMVLRRESETAQPPLHMFVMVVDGIDWIAARGCDEQRQSQCEQSVASRLKLMAAFRIVYRARSG